MLFLSFDRKKPDRLSLRKNRIYILQTQLSSPAMPTKDPILFEPLPMERVWGGRRLEALFSKTLPPASPIGEIWEIVDREDAQSVVHTGSLRGRTLNELWTQNRAEIFGADYQNHPSPRFPLLIKLLDARERLSVQVHPPASVAGALNGEPKTEMWYFADTQPGALIYAGVKPGVGRPEFEDKISAGRVEEAIHALPVQKGDSIFIPSGRLHAIGDGNVIVEIQQNSDTTYRVFDWNRTGLDGRPRTLHIEESLACIDFYDHSPTVDRVSQGTLASCDYFKVEKQEVTAETDITGNRFAIVAVLEGGVNVAGQNFVPGQFILIPAGGEPISPSNGTATILRVTLPV